MSNWDYAVTSMCIMCGRPIDLHHSIVPHEGHYVHYKCFVFSQYNRLINIAGGLIQAIEDEEDIDLDQLREDLLDAMTFVRGD